mgnify:CR=1 FL=1
MRVLLGIILGGILTVGGAYLSDSHHALEAANAPASAQRPLVKTGMWSAPNGSGSASAPVPNGSGSPAERRHAQALSAMR